MKTMNFKKEILLSMMVTLLVSTAGCSASEKNIVYDNNKDVTDISKLELTEQIENLAVPNEVHAGMSVCHSVDDLKYENIVKIVRFNKGRYYSVTPIENGQYLFLLYTDNNDHCVIDGYLASGFSDKNAFQDIEIGTNIEEILLKDANSCVLDNHSYHRFSDKSILVIEYSKNDDGKHLVSDYFYYYPGNYKDDQYRESVVDYLLPKDFELLL